MTKRIQIGAGISNQGKEISNRSRDYKSGHERLQTGIGISNKFQIEAGITNRCITQVKQ